MGTPLPLCSWARFLHGFGLPALLLPALLLPTLLLPALLLIAGLFSPASLSAQVPPVVSAISSTPRPATIGTTVTFTATASDADGDVLTYSWTFGDGTMPTPPATTATTTHAFASEGHFQVTCQVSDGVITRSRTRIQTVYEPFTTAPPAASATIVFDAGRNRVWTVNPDAGSIAAIDAGTLVKLFEVPVGRDPRSLALAPDGSVWVSCQRDSQVHVLSGTDGSSIATIALPYGCGPIGIAMAPNGAACYVAASAAGTLLRFDTATRALTGTLALGPTPRAIAISGDSSRILVTRFISPVDHGEVWEVAASSFTRTRTHLLAFDTGEGGDNATAGRGVPNYLMHVTISPDGRQAWIGAKKDNTARGLLRDGKPLGFESTVRSIICRIDLQANAELLPRRRDNDDRELPAAICFTPLGDYAFVAFQGNNRIDVIDSYSNARYATAIDPASLAPQGLCLDPLGSRLYVQGYLSRSVSAYDVSAVTQADAPTATLLGTTPTVASEPLTPQVLIGKRVFYNAADPRMGSSGYISCATCHLDGGHDGRVFDFSDRGEGFRNTTTLHGKRGTGHGRVHWTANFDEIQDFEHACRTDFGGTGFISDAQFAIGTRNQPLGESKAGLSADLDAMAAYVTSLNSIPSSPNRSPTGALTSAGSSGRAVFRRMNCQACHGGADFTDSASGLLHDVGTLKPTSGKRLNGPLSRLDTPTLLGLSDTAPYLHDGSAATLDDVFLQAPAGSAHGLVADLGAADRWALVSFLAQIDGSEPIVQPADRQLSVAVTRDGSPFAVLMALAPEHAPPGDVAAASRIFPALSADVTYTVTFGMSASMLATGLPDRSREGSWPALAILGMLAALTLTLNGLPGSHRGRALILMLGCLISSTAMSSCGSSGGGGIASPIQLSLSGTVTDGGSPTAGVAVDLTDGLGQVLATGTTRTDGTFLFAGIQTTLADVRLVVRRR